MKSINKIILEEIQKFGIHEDGDVIADIINAEFNKDNVVLETTNSLSNINQNFWNWFGQSKVVKNGKPLIMHHGGSFSPTKPTKDLSYFNEFKGIAWFTSSKGDARHYAKQSGGGNLTSVYLKIENPLYSGRQEDGSYIETNTAVSLAKKSNGKYDGVIDVENGEILDAIVWDSKQIKSIDNNGEYNSSEPDVMKETNNKPAMNKKLYYHGRKMGGRPYSGKYIFITDDLGYASGYSDGKILYTYTMPFDEQKLFSIKNVSHRLLLAKYVDEQTILQMRADSGPDQELDWATMGYMDTDKFDTPEDLLEYLGFYGIRLKERTGIESIYIFNESKLNFEGEIDITTQEMIKKIGKFYRDFSKDKNFLETTIKEEINNFEESLADTYAEKQFNMPNDVKAQDILAKGNLQKDLEKPYGYINNTAVYKNPQSLENFDADVRAIGCVSGNLYVAQKNGMFMHGQMGEYIGLDSSGAIYSGKYLLLNRDGNTNNFILSDTAEEDYPKYYEHFNNMIKNIETKNSNYKILASIDTVDSQ